MTGNALMRGSFSFSWVAGPSAGGLLVGLVTAPVALAVDAVSFAASALLVRGLALPDRAGPPPAAGGAADGLRLIARHRVLRPTVVCGTVLNLCWSAYFTLLVAFAVRELGLSPGQLGLAIGTGSAGALLGSVASVPVSRRLGFGRTLTLGAGLYAGALAAIPLAPRGAPWAACAIIAAAELVSGFGLMLDDVNTVSLQQAVTPEAALGRAAGAGLALNYGARAVAAPVAGVLGTWLGLSPTIALAAGAGVAAALALLLTPVRGMRELPAAVG